MAVGRLAGGARGVRGLGRLAILAVLLAGSPAGARAEDGWASYDASRFDEAVQRWRPAAAAGDPVAQFGLGIAYDLGLGVAPDPETACGWYRRAGAGGHALAAFNTAVMYDSGRCGPRRADLGAAWYARAAAAGHARAQFNLAQLYATGDGVPSNPELASAWFRAAAASGLAAASGRGLALPRPDPARPLLAVTPVGPQDAPPRAGQGTVLVWTGPAQPGRVRFFVEVAALRPGGAQEVMARYLDESAIQVELPAADRHFAWRVTTVGAEPARYVMTPWQRLDTQP